MYRDNYNYTTATIHAVFSFRYVIFMQSDVKGVHVALVVSMGVLLLMAPTVKERVLSLFSSSSCAAAYEGDGILVGDTGSSRYVPSWWFPYSSIEWKITQQPVFGDAHHTMSFFMVPEDMAHHYLYRFHSHDKSQVFYVGGGMEPELQHIPITSNVYLLPKEYTRHGKEAKAHFRLNILQNNTSSSANNEQQIYYLCQFQNRVNFRDFIDMEESVHSSSGCTHMSAGENNDPSVTLGSSISSYNFFSAAVPTNSYVQYETNINMYFYNHTKLGNFYKCMVRNVDTCTFTTYHGWWNPQRYLIIAYIHPTDVPSSLTTKISVEVNTGVWKTSAYLLLWVLIPGFVMKLLCSFCT